jgi:hypothetical protein
VAAVTDQQVGTGFQGGREIDSRTAAAGGADDGAERRADDGRPTRFLGQAASDESHDADRPGASDDDGRTARGRRRTGLGDMPGQVRRAARAPAE